LVSTNEYILGYHQVRTYARNTHLRHCDARKQSQSLVFPLRLRKSYKFYNTIYKEGSNSLKQVANNVFQIQDFCGRDKAILQVSLTGRTSSLVNELGVFRAC
jgi:hypothetical protein